MERIKHITIWMLLITGSSHILCCVLPTLLGLLNIVASLGVFSIWLPQLETWHDMMHEYEANLLLLSGVMLGITALVDLISTRIDCHSTGCHHGSCTPKKDRATLILLFATLLFAFNTASYYYTHKDESASSFAPQQDVIHDDHASSQPGQAD